VTPSQHQGYIKHRIKTTTRQPKTWIEKETTQLANSQTYPPKAWDWMWVQLGYAQKKGEFTIIKSMGRGSDSYDLM
jgi:hypothetical protein